MKEKRHRTNRGYPMEYFIRLWKEKTERAKINFGRKMFYHKVGKMLEKFEDG